MSKTTTINPASNGNNATDSKKKTAAAAGTAAAAAGVGVAGAKIISELNDDAFIEEPIEPIEVQEAEAGTVQPDTDAGSVSGNANASSTSVPSGHAVAAEPQPITANVEPEPVDVNTQQPVVQQEAVVAEPEQTVSNSETVGPNAIADAIISEQEIDPNDLDMDDVINFDEIGTVYTVDGESYTAAAFHDAAGNELVLLDVDGDDVFDVVTDMEGNLLADEYGNIISAGDMTVDDVELQIADTNTYLAANDDDPTDDFGIDSIMQDMIS